MAQVSISFGEIQMGFEDEDKSAKSLSRLALVTLTTLVEQFGIPEPEEEKADG